MIRFVFPLFLLLLAACAPTVANRGTIIDPEKLAQLTIGQSSREEVIQILGSPTQVATFDENTWYYFGCSTKQYSFLNPEITAQSAVSLQFDEAGILASIHTYEEGNAKKIAPVARRTPTYGRETTVFEQLLGNLGRPRGSSDIRQAR
ncbi:MAG: outer membrane protein assembly factor BamE [Alphaproteobacteria bacterium]|nr:outer membrane protein assembly factor BamE [Alphaproteobacteria bacterium]